ncbi:hypothetical protein HETIRDRAFT_104460 [Heterobasidion irregulare TC 32-1]|uniref:Uncharacterized protein n=1 Tax=Heterobasidion irregulare (strain TC 32-1) TaxID=747525 RepID=W4K024_HETIT|nr:uncharacterized protein HETIRDRAFT_104460 [Heterobasidion irregulare TC 32-1]ETW79173.1 hypothetical protein HETIRDRAFT_104460 [Heterobasidion irregulare TC 32-1]
MSCARRPLASIGSAGALDRPPIAASQPIARVSPFSTGVHWPVLSQAQGPPAGAPRRARYVLLLTVTTQLPNFCHLSRRATARTTAVSVLSRYATRRRFLTRLRLDARKPDGGPPWGASLLELKHGRLKLVREFEYSSFSCFFFSFCVPSRSMRARSWWTVGPCALAGPMRASARTTGPAFVAGRQLAPALAGPAQLSSPQTPLGRPSPLDAFPASPDPHMHTHTHTHTHMRVRSPIFEVQRTSHARSHLRRRAQGNAALTMARALVASYKLIRNCAARCGCGPPEFPRAAPELFAGSCSQCLRHSRSAPSGAGAQCTHTRARARALTLRACAGLRLACGPAPRAAFRVHSEAGGTRREVRRARNCRGPRVGSVAGRFARASPERSGRQSRGRQGIQNVDDCADVFLFLPDQARPGDAP